ncbi:hypothetical protein Ocin01_15754 [Orchesella cincta]|uniref:F-box domain-containing protein n=1 Tax=Orchesella cincta TaxID=48709 RepID=A0A1D2MD46_ORCCI|nr:hypothetical protein Ocin01_15754 [Orchesella cincta]
MSVITRSMAKKMAEAVFQEPPAPLSSSTIADLPPEMLEMILKNLDGGLNSMLPYRLVHPSWKAIIDDHLEKKSLKGETICCPKVIMVETERGIRCPPAILIHPGNPFPSRSLRVAGYRRKSERSSRTVVAFIGKFGNHLTTFILDQVCLSPESLVQILRHLSNLKVLKFKSLRLASNSEDSFDFESLPALPNLMKLELNSVYGGTDPGHFCSQFIDIYSDHLVFLEIQLRSRRLLPLQPSRPSSQNGGAFGNLRQLKVSDPNESFFQLSCSPPLQRISIANFSATEQVSIAVIMKFVDKFSNTLEHLDLDTDCGQLFNLLIYGTRWIVDGRVANLRTAGTNAGRRLSTAAVVFPKLTKFAVPYPSNDLESAVISKTFLVKFPALKELKLVYYLQAYVLQTNSLNYSNGHRQITGEFLVRQDYWKRCNKLNRISVLFTGEADNAIVRSPEYDEKEGMYKLKISGFQKKLCQLGPWMTTCVLTILTTLHTTRGATMKARGCFLVMCQLSYCLRLYVFWTTIFQQSNDIKDVLNKIDSSALFQTGSCRKAEKFQKHFGWYITYLYVTIGLLGICYALRVHIIYDNGLPNFTASNYFQIYVSSWLKLLNWSSLDDPNSKNWDMTTKYYIKLAVGIAAIVHTYGISFRKSTEILHSIIEKYDELKQLSDSFNKVWSFYFIVYICDTGISICFQAKDAIQTPSLIHSLIYVFTPIHLIIALIISAEIYRMISCVSSLLSGLAFRDVQLSGEVEFKMLIRELNANRIGIGSDGFYRLNYGFLAQLLVIAVTFVILSFEK